VHSCKQKVLTYSSPESAVFGDADAIVTGDKAMLKLRGYRNKKIITLLPASLHVPRHIIIVLGL
jgi:predicted nucleic acid-binding protein